MMSWSASARSASSCRQTVRGGVEHPRWAVAHGPRPGIGDGDHRNEEWPV